MTKDSERRQRWRAKQLAAGKCARCGKDRTQYAWHCDSCQRKVKKYRAKKGTEQCSPQKN